MSFLTKIFGDSNEREIKKLQPVIEKINMLEPEFESFSIEKLKAKTEEFKKTIKNKEELDEISPQAFAMVREAARRTLSQRHFDAQLMGGLVLHQGKITEMRTGEGKTLAATLPAYLNALSGKGVHVITVNDYLAKRDTVWMGQIYYFLGLTVGCITHEQAFRYDPAYNKLQIPTAEPSRNRDQSVGTISNDQNSKQDKERDEKGGFKVMDEFLRPVERKEAYQCDILYGTNNEFGFDYLRDNMVQSLEQKVQRELNYAIVDEIDSILIDEARTPLIISAPAEEARELYYKFAQLVRRLRESEDYNIDEKMRSATLTEEGIHKMEEWLGIPNIYIEGGLKIVHHIEQALQAQALFRRDKDYVVREGEIIIVDEFTGRLMPGRRYSEGLHQAIEAKEGVEIRKESQTLATITFQNYFRLYNKLAGMTGTALTEAEEFSKIYNLEVIVTPTNKPMIRGDMVDRIYKTEMGKFQAVIREIKERHEKGQPVLVGTISIEKNELLGKMLEREGVACNLLNAKNHEKEGEIIAQAGKPGAVTVATNMAGRGVDIVLGGNPPDAAEQKKVLESGGLHILGTERHESRRIDNQLRGRSGRQGDPGSSQFYVSMDDDLLRIFGSERMKGIMDSLGVPDDMPVENKIVSRSIEQAQHRVEGNNFDIRKHLLEYDDVLNKHREVIYKKRNEILKLSATGGRELKEKIMEMIESEIGQVVMMHTPEGARKEWNLEEIYEVANTIFPVPSEARIKMDEIKNMVGTKLEEATARTKIIEYLAKLSEEAYQKLEKEVKDSIKEIEKQIMLRAIDALWVEHLDAMAYLRTGIGLRGYAQEDPLVAYKKEAYRAFQELLALIQKQVVYSIYKVSIGFQTAPTIMEKEMEFSGAVKTSDKGGVLPIKGGQKRTKVGRNDPCPCGSGKKFKKCHGK